MHTTQEIVNRCLWLAGLLLEFALLVALVARRQSRQFPAFTLLLVFYVVRTTVLYSLSSHLADATFRLLYDGLSWMDLLLQVLVATEIARHIIRQGDGWTARLSGMLLLFLALAGCGGWLAGVIVRPYPRMTVDRGEVFISCLMVLLLGWAWWRSTSGPVRRIVEGFALYGLVALLAEAARIHAFVHRNAHSYLIWSYAPAVAFLAILVFWLITVKATGRNQRGTQAALSSTQRYLGPDVPSDGVPKMPG